MNVSIPVRELERLRKLERAHDDYLRALTIMGERRASLELAYLRLRADGAPGMVLAQQRWRAYDEALDDLSMAILQASSERGDR